MRRARGSRWSPLQSKRRQWVHTLTAVTVSPIEGHRRNLTFLGSLSNDNFLLSQIPQSHSSLDCRSIHNHQLRLNVCEIIRKAQIETNLIVLSSFRQPPFPRWACFLIARLARAERVGAAAKLGARAGF
jgi:hypothetical protein